MGWTAQATAARRARKRVQLFTSTALLQELSGILARRKFAKKVAASGLTLEQLVHGYATLASMVRPAMSAPTIKGDPDNDAVLATAVGARAQLIISAIGICSRSGSSRTSPS